MRAELAFAERYLDALLGLSESFMGPLDVQKTLPLICQRVAAAMGCDRCSVILVDKDSNAGMIVAASDDTSLFNHLIDLSAYPEIREALFTREPVLIDDVHREPLLDPVRDRITGKPIGAALLFPIVADQNAHGVLFLRTVEPRTTPLEKREIRFGRIVANATGVVLRNAHLHVSIRAQSERNRSQRREAERRLEQIQKYQRFFDFAGDGLLIIDGAGGVAFANRAARTIFGFADAAFTQMKLGDLVDGSSHVLVDKILDAVRCGRSIRDLDLPVVRSSGEIAILSITMSPLFDASGSSDLPRIGETHETEVSTAADEATAILSLRDVTKTRKMERDLRQTKDFLINLIGSSADAIVAADMKGRILIFNESAAKITGYDPKQMIGRDLRALYPPGAARDIMTELRSDGRGGPGKLHERKQVLVAKDGSLIPVNLSASIVYDGSREVATVGIFADLRERLRIEDELAKAQNRLKISEQRLGIVELAGAAAHELNQPLTSIIGSVELLQRKLPRDFAGSGLVETILSQAERMADIVRKIGGISNVETKPYLGSSEIIDLDASSAGNEGQR